MTDATETLKPADDAAVDVAVAMPSGTPCAACGGAVEPGEAYCPACGRRQEEPGDVAAAQVVAKTSFQCKNCGSVVSTDADRRSYVCAFCDSPYVVEFSPDVTGRQAPEFVIGFALTREQAMAAFRRWLGRQGLFRPGDLARAATADKLRGIYLPFWSFSMLARSRWSASIGEYWYRTRRVGKGKTQRVRETQWWPLSGRHHHYYSGHLVSGSTTLPPRDAERIKPFHLPALKRYQPYYLAGWLCEEYTVERAAALEACQQEFLHRERRNVAAFLPGDTHRGLDASTLFEHVNSDLCLLPVYLLSYRYRGRVYRFFVNGQTGKAAGDKPLSWLRVGIAVGVVALLGAAVAALAVLGG